MAPPIWSRVSVPERRVETRAHRKQVLRDGRDLGGQIRCMLLWTVQMHAWADGHPPHQQLPSVHAPAQGPYPGLPEATTAPSWCISPEWDAHNYQERTSSSPTKGSSMLRMPSSLSCFLGNRQMWRFKITEHSRRVNLSAAMQTVVKCC